MRRTPFVLACLAGTIALHPASAQNTGRPGLPPGTGAAGAPAASPATVASWAQQVVNIRFPGGPAKAYVDMVRAAAAPAVINVVYANQAAETRLPPIELSNVSVMSAFDVIGQMENPEGGNPARAILVSGQRSPLEAPVFRVDISGGGGRPGPDSYRVVSLSDITSNRNRVEGAAAITSAAALRAIETAVEVSTGPEDPTPTLKYHEETGTLVIAGNKQQCAIAEEVVSNLRRDATRNQEVDRSKRRIVEQVKLRNVAAPGVMTQIAAVFSALSGKSDLPGTPAHVAVSADPNTNSVVLSGPQDYVMLGRAVIGLLDDDKVSEATRAAEERLRALAVERELQQRAAELTQSTLKDELALTRKNLDDASKQAMTARVEAEAVRTTSATSMKQAEDMRAEINRMRDILLTSERQLAVQQAQLKAELDAAREQNARLEAVVAELQQQLKSKK